MRPWSLLATLWGAVCAHAQYGVPVYAPPPLVMQPMVVAQLQHRAASTTTPTTTTKIPRNVAVAMPVPMPMPLPVPFPLPAYAVPHACQASPSRPSSCPPCPPCLCSPSCTPAFFSYCSPCHQKCRCRDSTDAPQPLPPLPHAVLPVPLPGPPPVLVVPFPPLAFPKPRTKHKPKKYASSDASSCAFSGSSGESSDSATSSDTDYVYKRARKQKSRRKRRRRPARRSEVRSRDDERVHPVLTYLSRSGDIKYKAKISEAEAARLLGERAAGAQRVHVKARGAERASAGGTSGHPPRSGRKEIVFRPPAHKAISNLSVSFQISK